jgi:hypothetical protein
VTRSSEIAVVPTLRAAPLLMLVIAVSSARAEAGPAPCATLRDLAPASAETNMVVLPDATTIEADPPLPEGDTKRPLPAYRPRSTDPLSVAAWIPRVLLAPAYVTSHLVARPVGLVATAVERYHVRERLREFFTFGPRDEFQLYPVAYIDWGFQPSVGGYFSWQPAAASSEGHVRVMTGGPGFWDARSLWRLPEDRRVLEIAVRYTEREDAAFYGIGRDSPNTAWRHGERQLDEQVRYRLAIGSNLALTSRVIHEWWSFDPATTTERHLSLARAIASDLPAPPALDGGLLALGAGFQVELDTRRGRVSARPRTVEDYAHVAGSGVALHADVTSHVGLRRTRADAADPSRWPAWLSYAATLTGTLDLTGTQRRLDLEAYAAFADPVPGAAQVPFTHVPSLGGARPLRGFPSRRFIDRSAAALTLRYRWPIWSTLDGNVSAAAGNVFGSHLTGFAVPDLRASFGLGVSTATSAAHAFELLLAFGTEPFSGGLAPVTGRIAAGTTLPL